MKLNNKKLIYAGLLAFGSSYALFVSCGSSGTNNNQTGVGQQQGGQLLSPDLPFDVTIRQVPNKQLETTIRADFDLFSWQSFVALNWSNDSNQKIGANGDNSTIWETWKESYEVFLADGKTPAPWGQGSFVPPACAPPVGDDVKLLLQVGKTPNVLDELDQPFKTGPLIDQNGQYSRFEILMNEEMFNYVYDNGLYSFTKQQQFKGTVDFPSGNNSTKKWGAIMVKAAWKILGKDDDASRFHTTKALIYVPPTEDPVIPETCYVATVGLVGLHIGTKTEICPQWIWSTFEQVDNVPTFGQPVDKNHYNYYNPANGDKDLNNAPPRPWNPNIKGQRPSQVKRLDPIYTGTDSLNKIFQQQFREVNPKSVWQYYQLVGTQWPVNPEQKPAGNPFPVYMANTTLETYIQGVVEGDKVKFVPGVTSSCIGCHNGATMKSNGKASDFTFLLERAQ